MRQNRSASVNRTRQSASKNLGKDPQLSFSLVRERGPSSEQTPSQVRSSFSKHGLLIRRSPPIPTIAYDTYWQFAHERQEVFFRRLAQEPHPWTNDEILQRYKFTNVYRASDRTSQYLIKRVLYSGLDDDEEIFFRAILFKLFNKIETWELLQDALGPLSFRTYSFAKYDRVLTQAIDSGRTIYSAAYIMPAGGRADSLGSRKHRHHLRLLELMMRDRVAKRLQGARSMAEGFRLLKGFASIGNFLAYQLITDINYSELTSFREDEFVMPGPGARDGIRKCFSSLGDLDESDVIRFVQGKQDREFESRGLSFRTLWGRPLQLVDCQNIFCEVDKYSRVRHPELMGVSKRTRIKQHFAPRSRPDSVWYPPKWGINPLSIDLARPASSESVAANS